MIYKKFQNINVSRLGMGAMRLPVKEKEQGTPIDREKAQELIDYAISQGINYFDTAYIYHDGESESFLGEALLKYPRDSYYIADKFNLHANPDYKVQFAEQLSRLQTEYIDFYLLHGIQDHIVDTFLSNGCVEYFEELKKSGKIRYLGFSFHGSPKVLKRVMEERSWDFVQIQLNYSVVIPLNKILPSAQLLFKKVSGLSIEIVYGRILCSNNSSFSNTLIILPLFISATLSDIGNTSSWWFPIYRIP